MSNTLSADLEALGFTMNPFNPAAGDFFLQDDSDGNGPYIRFWNSEQPCPFPELIREPIQPDPQEQ